MDLKYTIAGLNIQIQSNLSLCESGFSPLFSASFDAADLRFTVDCVDALSDIPLNAESSCICRRVDKDGVTVTHYKRDDGKPYLQLRLDSGVATQTQGKLSIVKSELEWAADMYYLWPMLGLQDMLTRFGGIMLHAAFIETQGSAILFLAPSGGGKTTQAELWKKYLGARIINGDRAIVRAVDGTFTAFGLPISGTSKDCSAESYPLRAIVAPIKSAKNDIRRCGAARAIKTIGINTVYSKWDYEVSLATRLIAGDIASRIPVFELDCLPEVSAARLLSNALEDK